MAMPVVARRLACRTGAGLLDAEAHHG